MGTVYTDVATTKVVQEALNAAGFNCGTPDGIAGAKTTEAINAFETAKGINVNAISPGYFMTQPNREFFAADPDFYDMAVSLIPAGKIGDPEQLAGTLLYLASGASDYLHGSIIQVDGGYMIW